MSEKPFGLLLDTVNAELSFDGFLEKLQVEHIPYVLLTNETGGPLRLWFMDTFYVDLPPDRYTDTVIIDWAVVLEQDGKSLRQCRVKPTHDSQWETFEFTRKQGEDQ